MVTSQALLIGCQALGLEGPNDDVAAMAALLDGRGFAVTTLTGAKATRQGIIDAYEALIGRSQAKDAVVVYYSGHGGFGDDAKGNRVQFIVPVDWDESEQVFRGITDPELSDLLARLTDKTANVTAIFDCCHAARISRGAKLRARGLNGRWTPALAKHFEQHTPPRKYVAGNPHAARLVATEAHRSAYEAPVDLDGKTVWRGLFTVALERLLKEPESSALSWRSALDRVREQVLDIEDTQRPDVEGPADRVLFTTSELSRPDAVVYFEHDGAAALRASRLQGAREGLSYGIVRRGAIADEDEIATITESEGSVAYVDLTDVKAKLEVGALAFPRKKPFAPVTVALVGTDAALASRLARDPMIEVVSSADDGRFVVEVMADTVVLSDHDAQPASTFRYPRNDAKRDLIVRQIARWAKAEALRNLQPWGLSAAEALEVTWGAVEAGTFVARQPGDAFHAGDKICVRAKNVGSQRLYLWIFDIGITGKVTLLSTDKHGLVINADKILAVGEDNGVLTGLGMSWPAELASMADGRPESVVVLAADHMADASVFENVALTRGKDANSPLANLLRDLGAGRTRDISAASVGQRYTLVRIDFTFLPAPAAAPTPVPATHEPVPA